jgi:electron transfer flavoprotein alpha/beta subunit
MPTQVAQKVIRFGRKTQNATKYEKKKEKIDSKQMPSKMNKTDEKGLEFAKVS